MTARSRTPKVLYLPCLMSITVLATVTGCGGSSARPAAALAAGTSAAVSSVAPQAKSAAPTTPPSTTAPAARAGSGDFCKAIAASLGRAAPGGPATAMKAELATVRTEAEQAASLAPQAIKGDVTLLMSASLAVWDALAKVDYDYSKLKASDMSALSTPEVAVAEKRLTAYMSGTCGLEAGKQAGTS